MAFCGKCGHKNPEGNLFCSACGAKLEILEPTVADNAPRENEPPREPVTPHVPVPPYEPVTPRESVPQREMPRQRERVILHKEGSLPPRLDSAQPQPQPQQPKPQSQPQPQPQTQPTNLASRSVEKPKKKSGSGIKKGILHKALLWVIGLVPIIGGGAYGVSSLLGSKSNGADTEEVSGRGLLGKDYERSFDDARLAKLQNRHEFPSSNLDVSLQPGTYTAQIEEKGMKGTITLKVEDVNKGNKQIVGKVDMTGHFMGETMNQSFIITYAGNSIYALYPDEDEIGSMDAMVLYVTPDGKTIEAYDYGEVLFTFKKD